jgi:hypothetical protein
MCTDRQTDGEILIGAPQGCELLKIDELHQKQRYMIQVLHSFDHAIEFQFNIPHNPSWSSKSVDFRASPPLAIQQNCEYCFTANNNNFPHLSQAELICSGI